MACLADLKSPALDLQLHTAYYRAGGIEFAGCTEKTADFDSSRSLDSSRHSCTGCTVVPYQVEEGGHSGNPAACRPELAGAFEPAFAAEPGSADSAEPDGFVAVVPAFAEFAAGFAVAAVAAVPVVAKEAAATESQTAALEMATELQLGQQLHCER